MLKSSGIVLTVAPKGMYSHDYLVKALSHILYSVGYVEFKNEESVSAAIRLTGQMLAGIPVIAQLTEAEKNRQAARNPEAPAGNHHTAPFHRLYVGNVHFSITEKDITNVFEPFGDLEFVQLQTDESGRSKGYAFVQYVVRPCY